MIFFYLFLFCSIDCAMIKIKLWLPSSKLDFWQFYLFIRIKTLNIHFSTDEDQNLKVISSSNGRKSDRGPEWCFSPFIWSIAEVLSEVVSAEGWLQEAVLKEGKQGEKTELHQITEEKGWKS